ncbi:4-hydroxy-tetrahydrodipicolinate synthase [[Brevibacterium] frigoritolerans]|nr:4-hydroxy-tetrahydrodipicolinate synthase [Peribacillus frigoritolerans]
MDFGRIITAMVTPFDDKQDLQIDKVRALVNHLENTGTDTFVLGGTTGEGPTLTDDEKSDLLNEVYKNKENRTKIIMNVGTNNTKETVEKAIKWSNNRMVDAVMVVSPYYNKPNQLGLFKHFEAVNDSIEKPIMAYHIPGRTNVTMTAETMIKIANLSNVTMLKDAEGDFDKLKVVIGHTQGLWDIYSGDDPILVDYLEIGSKGVVSVASHIVGEAIVDLLEAYDSGARDSANEIQSYIKKVSETLFPTYAPNPVAVKYVLDQLGLVQEEVRLPLTTLELKEKEWIKSKLKTLRIL